MIQIDEKIVVEALKQVKEILDEHGINVWLCTGSLLGAKRDGKIIPWDHDVDLATWYENSSQIIPIFDEFRKLGFEIYFFESQSCIKILKKNCEIEISLYQQKDDDATMPCHVQNKLGQILDYLLWALSIQNASLKKSKIPLFMTSILIKITKKTSENLRKNLITIITKLYQKIGHKIIYVAVPSHFFKNLSSLDFYGMNFKVPKETEKYLEYVYGTDWRIPKRDYYWERDDQSLVRD